MFKSKPEFKRMPQVQQHYDLEETIGVASRKKYLEDMKMRIEEAENRGKNVRLRNDWLQHQKKSLYQGELDSINRQLERPMMPVRTKEELEKETKRIKRYNGGNNLKSNLIIMIKTLKSELRLRPTYDEMIGMINEQGDENRPSIETVIDRKATLFRNNQFGSRFDNVDFLGLKKQEENKVKEELRQTQLRQTAMATGSSMGVLSYGGRTPVGAYNTDGFETPDSDEYRMTLEQINRVRTELETHQQRRRDAQQASSSAVRSDLDETHSQSLPAGVPVHSIATDEEEEEMPPLETPTEVAEEEEEEYNQTQDVLETLKEVVKNQNDQQLTRDYISKLDLNDWSKINPKEVRGNYLRVLFKIADKMGQLNEEEKEQFNDVEKGYKTTGPDTDERREVVEQMRELFKNVFHEVSEDDDETQVPPQSRKHKEMIDYNDNIDRWKNKDVSVDDILYQLHLRGIQLTEEQEEEMSKLKIKGKGKSTTKKDYLINYIERLIQTGKWTDEVNDQLLRSRMEEWSQMKKGKGKGVIRRAFESAGSALLDAGKQVAKEAVIEGAKSAVMSLL